MAISAKLVKELREKTGAGMMDCKKALEACDGDIEASFDWLREKGIAKSAKKADRIAAEGLSAFAINGNVAAMVEVNSETDFVAKNAEFVALVNTVCEAVAANNPADLEAAKAIEVEGKTLETTIAEASGKIGEKLSLRRIKTFTKDDNEVFGAYSHMGGKMVSIVKLADATESSVSTFHWIIGIPAFARTAALWFPPGRRSRVGRTPQAAWIASFPLFTCAWI